MNIIINLFFFSQIVLVPKDSDLQHQYKKKRDGLQASQIRSSTINSDESQFLYQTPPVPIAPTIYKNVAKHPNAESFSLSRICELVKLFKKDLPVFDPIRFNIVIWLNALERLIVTNDVQNLALMIIPSFLEKVGKSYFSYLKQTDDELDYQTFKKQFIIKFSSFKCLKIQEAFDYKHESGANLIGYVNKKWALIEYVLPDLKEIEMVQIVISGLDSRVLTDIFTKDMAANKESLLAQVSLHQALFDDDVSGLNFDISNIIPEDNQAHGDADGVNPSRQGNQAGRNLGSLFTFWRT